MQRMRGGLAVSAAVLALFATSPAHAGQSGGGLVTGTYSCAAGVASFVLDAPAFDFVGQTGALHVSGTTSCMGMSILADSGVGTFTAAGPGVTCDAVGGAWTWVGGELRLGFGGPCAFGGGGENVQFFVEAVAGAGTFAGAIVATPTF